MYSDEERFVVENERSAMDSDDDEEDLKKPRSSTAPSGSSNSTQTQEDFQINAPNLLSEIRIPNSKLKSILRKLNYLALKQLESIISFNTVLVSFALNFHVPENPFINAAMGISLAKVICKNIFLYIFKTFIKTASVILSLTVL